jgi:hypothetical protein
MGSVIATAIAPLIFLCSVPLSFSTRRVYQLALTTPGISPERANSRKQIRQMPNFLRYARERPHRLHLLYERTLNFGGLFDFAIQDFFATSSSVDRVTAATA